MDAINRHTAKGMRYGEGEAEAALRDAGDDTRHAAERGGRCPADAPAEGRVEIPEGIKDRIGEKWQSTLDILVGGLHQRHK